MLYHHREGYLSIMDMGDKLVAKGLFSLILNNIGSEEHCCSAVSAKSAAMGNH